MTLTKTGEPVIHQTNRQWVLISDLDGSLLDHHDYSFTPAQPLLAQLQAAGVDVVLCTSKTRAEVVELRTRLNNTCPFVVENGAAVYLPKVQFSQAPAGAVSAGEFWVRRFVPARETWLALLEGLKESLAPDFTHFAQMSDQQVADATGLSLSEAELAKAREFGEPLLWCDSQEALAEAVLWLQARGATVLQGGRFVHVCGNTDKGAALQWLVQQYQHDFPSQSFCSMALGDSDNDVAMLDAADYAVVIRSPVKVFPLLLRQEGVYHTHACGPEGWVEGAQFWFERCRAEVCAPIQ